MAENYNCDGVAYLINGILYLPRYSEDGEIKTHVVYAPLEQDAFEYSPNYDLWISDFFI